MGTLRRLFSPEALLNGLRDVAGCFPFTLAYVSVLVLWLVAMVFCHESNYKVVNDAVCWSMFEGTLLSLAVSIWCSFMNRPKTLRLAQVLVAVLVLADMAVMIVREGVSESAEFIGRAAVVSALVAAIFFLPALKRSDVRSLLCYTMLQAGAAATAALLAIVMGVACGVIFVSLNLLFDIYVEKIMLACMCLLCIWLPTVVFLSKIPEDSDLRPDFLLSGNSPVSAFCKNVLLPLVLVYTAILYVYAAKILFTWELPNASVTWMVAGLLCVTLIVLYGLQRYSYGQDMPAGAMKIAAMARAILPVALLPLIVLMTVGLVYRIGEYGVTSSRLYVAVFNIWAYSVVFCLIFRKKTNLNAVAASFALVFALVSVIPGANLTSIARSMVRAEIVETLKAHGVEAFPVDEARVKSILRGIDRKEAKKLASKIDYLDDWKDHSGISDIVRADYGIRFRLYDYVRYPGDTEIRRAFDLRSSEAVSIPEGYSKVFNGSNRSLYYKLDSAGISEFTVNDHTFRLNADSLLNVGNSDRPILIFGNDEDGDTAALVFTRLYLREDSLSHDMDVEYYMFIR